jgi:hypothetical protein
MDIKTKLILNNITQEFEKRINALIDICESPIEEYFLINICEYFYSQSLMSLKFDFLVRWVDDPFSPNTEIIERSNYQEKGINVFGFIYGINIDIGETVYKIIPQFKHNNYRLDFAIFIEKPDMKVKFCIECDGHEFHKTKEQNLKDSERTRNLAKDGWTTLRYTGSELFKWSDYEN